VGGILIIFFTLSFFTYVRSDFVKLFATENC